MTIIVFILILSILVLVHELGHFFSAKKSGIRVEEFGLGLPPKIWGKQFGETFYSLNALPFGGFVKLTGEDTVEGGKVPDPRSFSAKSPSTRLLVLLSGVAMNTLLAVLLFYVFFLFNNFKSFYLPLFFDYHFKFGEVTQVNTVIMDVQKDSAAEKAGLQVGEVVLEIDGKEVTDVKEIRDAMLGKQGKELSVKTLSLRDQLDPTVCIKNFIPSLDEKGNPILGVYLGKSVQISYNKPVEKLSAGFLHAYNVLFYSMDAFKNMIGISVETKDLSMVSQSVSGPVGIYSVVGSILKYGKSSMLLTIIDYVALMSISLAFINVMPFPALDGGRALFVVIEAVRGKKFNPVWEANIHRVGMFLLLGLITLITIKDIAR